MEHIWDDLLSQQDRAVIDKTGYAEKGAASWNSRNLGRSPVLLVIDMQRFIIGRNVPILEAIEDDRLAMGQIAWKAIGYIVPFLAVCREVGLPIIYTRIIPRGRTANDGAVQIVEPVAPRAGDLVLDKNYASAFYGTTLLTDLTQHRADSVILVGNSTSGCLRATVVDARQMGFDVVVPRECTFDRIQASHKIALLDMWMKYAVVMSFDEAMAYVKSLSEKWGSYD